MGLKEVLGFIKIEHTLFSLPFVFIGAIFAGGATIPQLIWILIAAIGARGLAMALNRIIDKDIDAANPRTANRHLPSGIMSMNTAWSLSGLFLIMLLIGAWMLNNVALMMVWLPVLCFLIYPYMKRKTWACHIWLGLCLGLAPAGVYVLSDGLSAWVGCASNGFSVSRRLVRSPAKTYLTFGLSKMWLSTIVFIPGL